MVDFEQARKAMVDMQLRTSNVTDRRILGVMGSVPRENFVPESRRGLAYIDEAQDFGGGRALAAPAPFAKLIQLAEIQPTDRVLDLGAGTGYSTAVLAGLAADVTGVEADAVLVAEGSKALAALNLRNARIVQADFANAPKVAEGYDLVVLEGAVESVPPALFGLLKDGGRLVASLARGPVAVANIFVKSGNDVNSRAEFNANMPALGGAKPAEDFVF